MSNSFKTLDGIEVTSQFTFPPDYGTFGEPMISIEIGDYKMSIDEFCNVSRHLLAGGLAGWPKKGEKRVAPKCVAEVLSFLLDVYVVEDGQWIRKDFSQKKE